MFRGCSHTLKIPNSPPLAATELRYLCLQPSIVQKSVLKSIINALLQEKKRSVYEATVKSFMSKVSNSKLQKEVKLKAGLPVEAKTSV